MRNFFAIITFSFFALSVQASNYKCYASKYPTDMYHAFEDGFVTLSTTAKTVNFKYYYVNSVAKETTVEYEGTYKLKGIHEGNGQVKGMLEGEMTSHKGGFDGIDTIFFDTSLAEGKTKNGIVGKFAFSGHGYSWDWNLCYNVPK